MKGRKGRGRKEGRKKGRSEEGREEGKEGIIKHCRDRAKKS
jgi:hypothetical protein